MSALPQTTWRGPMGELWSQRAVVDGRPVVRRERLDGVVVHMVIRPEWRQDGRWMVERFGQQDVPEIEEAV